MWLSATRRRSTPSASRTSRMRGPSRWKIAGWTLIDTPVLKCARGRCAQNLDLVGQDWRGGTQLAEQTGAHVRPVDANLDRANESRRQLVDRHAGDPGRMRERPVNARPHQDLDTTALRDTPQRLGLWIEAVDRHVDQAAPAGLRKGAQLLHSRVLVVDQQVVARLIRVLGPGRP